MNTTTTSALASACAFELRFASLFDEGRGYAFPCDAEGHVDLDSLSARALANYFCGRTLTLRAASAQAMHGISPVPNARARRARQRSTR